MPLHRRRNLFPVTLTVLILGACVRAAPDPGSDITASQPTYSPTFTAANTRAPATPSFFLQATRIPGSPILTSTPDTHQVQPESGTDPDSYIVQSGDTLGTIAQQFGISIEVLMGSNALTDPDTLSAGQVLTIPTRSVSASGSSFKIIPDSELICGPMSILLDVRQYVNDSGGYLKSYAQIIDGELVSGSDIILRVASDYSVNPRLLLALLEYRSGWVTNPNPALETLNTPLDAPDGWYDGLYHQLTWAANMLNRGYYLWRVGGVAQWNLADGTAVPVDPGINAGTAGVQALFAGLDDSTSWQMDVSSTGFFSTLYLMFGYPFDLAIEPIVPAGLIQPVMQLPFEKGIPWAFTGGPHGGWDTGSAWAALDFSPAGTEGCVQSNAWVVAVADGLIVRSDIGAVVQDLDADGYEQTGWTVLYMHIDDAERVPVGTYLNTGDRIGYPSCEGGVADATHLHLARRINGEWIPADGSVPFDLGGWISSGTGIEYDGYLTRNGRDLEAYNGTDIINQIQR